MARVYMPVLQANVGALETGANEVLTEIDGRPWVQEPYAYQGKCLNWLRGPTPRWIGRRGRWSIHCSRRAQWRAYLP